METLNASLGHASQAWPWFLYLSNGKVICLLMSRVASKSLGRSPSENSETIAYCRPRIHVDNAGSRQEGRAQRGKLYLHPLQTSYSTRPRFKHI